MSKQTGIVKWFSASRGIGFITPKNGGEDVLVHIKAIHSSGYQNLVEGQAVSFETDANLQAENITLL